MWVGLTLFRVDLVFISFFGLETSLALEQAGQAAGQRRSAVEAYCRQF